MLTEGVPVTVDGLHRRTGVSRPSFYRRYPSTDALVSHITAERFAALPVPDTGALGGDIRAVVGGWRDLLTDPVVLAGVSRTMASQDRPGVDAGGILRPCTDALT